MALCLGSFAIVSNSFAETSKIYRITHKDGSVSYSDQPSPGAVEVVLKLHTNTMQSAPPSVSTQPRVTQKKREYQLNIISPQADASIRSNLGEINIAASIRPTLAGIYQLSINEQTIDSATGVFNLKNMNRGTYQYQVKFIDNSGKVIASSELRSLHLHKASALIN